MRYFGSIGEARNFDNDPGGGGGVVGMIHGKREEKKKKIINEIGRYMYVHGLNVFQVGG